MKSFYWNPFAKWAAGVVIALGLSRGAFAQESLEQRVQRLEKQNEEIRKNADIFRQQSEMLQKQNEFLLKILDTKPSPGQVSTPAPTVPVDDVRGLVNTYLQEREAKQHAADTASTAADGYKVGTDLRMSVRWNDGLLLETPHKDFFFHIGGWLQNDAVFFSQSRDSIKSLGDYQDGDFFRRVRLQMDGGVWQVGEFNMIFGFESTQKSIVSIFEMWGGLKDIPVLGAVRLGRMWTPHGLEGDDATSNRAMTFLERSSMSEAFYTQNFATGIFQGNSILCDRVTYQSMAFVPDLPGSNSGDFFGDGEFAFAGRVTGLPIYEKEGWELLHLGGSATWTHATRGGNEDIDPQSVRFRARPEQRDFASDIDGTIHDGTINPGDTNRLVDTGSIRADASLVLGTEVLYILGPLSLQGEYAFTAATGAIVGGKNVGDQWFNGGYIQVSYFLTGENRAYDKRFGRLGSYYLNGPYTPFWFVRDQNGGLNWGIGAWEVAARYSHLDLNSAGNVVQGGEMDGLTLGLNWYLNRNFKIQFQYIHDYRYNLAGGVPSGFVEGLGVRAQFAF